MNETIQVDAWSEKDTLDFIKYGKYFVPHREIQFQTIKTILPDLPDGSYVVDICCGEGGLSEYLLQHIPNINILALDGDQKMLDITSKKLAKYEGRVKTKLIDVFEKEWRSFDLKIGAFVSSLAIHHLDDEQKNVLFKDLYNELEMGGCIILADLIKPKNDLGKKIAAIQWDRAVMERSLLFSGDLEAFEAFERLEWNSYRDPNFENDPVDKPSTLGDQIKWMENAGLQEVDVFWMMAGHVIFGGYKTDRNV